MRLLLLLAVPLLFACNSGSQKPSEEKEAISLGDSSKALPAPLDTEPDSVMHVKFEPGVKEVIVKGKMIGIDKRIVVLVPVSKGQVLTAIINPEDSVANVRISQIVFANEKADGPFGREVTKEMPEDGTCTIIIAENLMQGDEWKGEFELTLRLK